jgi:hypothetical protein
VSEKVGLFELVWCRSYRTEASRGGFYFAPQDTTKVKADLIDQQSGRIVASVISIESQPESGLVPLVSVGGGHVGIGYNDAKLVLRDAAWGTASKIDAKMMQP